MACGRKVALVLTVFAFFFFYFLHLQCVRAHEEFSVLHGRFREKANTYLDVHAYVHRRTRARTHNPCLATGAAGAHRHEVVDFPQAAVGLVILLHEILCERRVQGINAWGRSKNRPVQARLPEIGSIPQSCSRNRPIDEQVQGLATSWAHTERMRSFFQGPKGCLV